MTKEKILEIADKQMKAGGYDALSFREIAEQLNVTKANIHHHYKNKLSLAIAVTDHYASIKFEEMGELLNSFDGDFISFVASAEEMFWQESLLYQSCSVCVCSQIVQKQDVPEELVQLAQSHFDKMQSLFTRAVGEAIDKGFIKEGLDPMRVAMQFSIVVFGVSTLAQTMPSVEMAKDMLYGQIYEWAQSLRK